MKAPTKEQLEYDFKMSELRGDRLQGKLNEAKTDLMVAKHELKGLRRALLQMAVVFTEARTENCEHNAQKARREFDPRADD